MNADFTVAACHCDHAGKAHLTVKHMLEGAQIAVQHMPFDAVAGQNPAEEQARILAKAAEIMREAASFLAAESRLAHDWPTHASVPGAWPQADEAPNAFGQPVPATPNDTPANKGNG